ncbi:unnamed protein product [Clonostachys rosea f. rosea IK726]|uniref:Uncharacterized protein n=1 Tax=Clonostachys rosea f. rosea IK726 TaxID=1349383 RepID=A0ACA9U707_BIOOC|nr:unnamed protein product [Clonostachys rosea f. rosea IK726]
MGHQADRIPWESLASSLEWQFEAECCFGATNFHPRRLDSRQESFMQFVNTLSARICECARQERLKFPERDQSPSPEDVVISDRVAQKLNPTIETWRRDRELRCKLYLMDEPEWEQLPNPADRGDFERMLYQRGHDGMEYRQVLPIDQRKMKAFLYEHTTSECRTLFETNGPALFSAEVAKTLLMRGEMGTLLRICSHPEAVVRTWRDAPRCGCSKIGCYDPSEEIGWRRMHTSALMSYIVLNVLSYFPDQLGKGSQYPAPEKDYRHSKAYQNMVIQATEHRWTADVTQLPHRLFFGLERGQLSPVPKKTDDGPGDGDISPEYPFMSKGFMPYDQFLNCQSGAKGHLPTAVDIAQVRAGLINQTQLPPELVNDILVEADYDAPQSRLRVPHHPFHADNAEDLKTYIEYCWAILVRCEMVAREMGEGVGWHNDITRVVNACFNCYRGPKSLGMVYSGRRIGPGAGRDLLIQYQMIQRSVN